MKLASLFFLISLEVFGAPILGEHPNERVQLPSFLVNQSGIDPALIQNQFPQNWFAFSGVLLGYFDPVLPATQVIWTTLKTASVEREEVPVERFIVPPLPPVPPVVPPTVDNPIQPPVVPPHHICYHNCHPEPPSSDVPEVSSGQIVLVAIGATFLLYLWGNRIEKRKKDRK